MMCQDLVNFKVVISRVVDSLRGAGCSADLEPLPTIKKAPPPAEPCLVANPTDRLDACHSAATLLEEL